MAFLITPISMSQTAAILRKKCLYQQFLEKVFFGAGIWSHLVKKCRLWRKNINLHWNPLTCPFIPHKSQCLRHLRHVSGILKKKMLMSKVLRKGVLLWRNLKTYWLWPRNTYLNSSSLKWPVPPLWEKSGNLSRFWKIVLLCAFWRGWVWFTIRYISHV